MSTITDEPTILLVDDSNIVRKAHRKALIAGGYQHFLEAENGLEALNLIGTEQIDIVIADINMPKMDGIEFLRLLRSREEGKDLPVVVVSGNTSVTNVVQAVKLQATFVLTKPVTPEQLCKHVAQALKAEDLEVNPNWSIAVTDPLPAARKVLIKLLQDLGLKSVKEASNLKELEQILKTESPNLIIVDWSLAGDNLRAVVGNSDDSINPSRIPVIVTSAETRREYVIEAAQRGVGGFLGKPFGVQTLKQKIIGVVA